MGISYSPGAATDRDRIRARIGDTDVTAPTNQRLEDEEIADLLITEGSFRSAAAAAARSLAAKYLRLATQKTVGNLSLIWQRRYDDLVSLANEIRKSNALTAVPLAGGMSLSEKQSDVANEDMTQPAFRRKQFDSPRAITAPGSEADQKDTIAQ